MTSLLQELQDLAVSDKTSVAELVRRSKVVASKLQLDEFLAWLDAEIAGYMGAKDVPLYRRVKGELRAHNPFNGTYMPIIAPASLTEKLTSTAIRNPIAALDELCGDKDGGFLKQPLSDSTVESLRTMLDGDSEWVTPFVMLQRAQAKSVVQAVRDQILDWSLRLERSGVVGDGFSFTATERDLAAEATSITIENFTSIVGNVGVANINQGDGDSLSAAVQATGLPAEEKLEFEKLLKEKSEGVSEDPSLRDRASAWIGRNVVGLGDLAVNTARFFGLGT